jgi:hypothetical protein
MKKFLGTFGRFMLLGILLFQKPLYILAIGDKPVQPGFERTERRGDNWKWGTAGHGSFDTAIQILNAEKDVTTYTTPQAIYRVFTHADFNFVEMVCSWGGGTLTYITKIAPDNTEKNAIKTSVESADGKAGSQKIDRVTAPWSWGTFNFGSFENTAALLKAEGDIISFRQEGRTKYRVFTHGQLNFVEVDYGWPGGVFKYTTRVPKSTRP